MGKSLSSEVWPMLMFEGILAILLGLFTFAYPGITLALIVLFFGIYALIDGAVLTIRGLGSIKSDPQWWVHLIGGLISLGAGYAVFVYPGLTVTVLYWIIAIWALATGLVRLFMAVNLRKEITDEWFLGLSGVVSILLGILLMTNPGAGLTVLAWYIGAYALISGILAVTLSLKIKKL